MKGDTILLLWDYNIFKPGRRLLLFCKKDVDDVYRVYPCSHSEIVANNKKFYRLYRKISIELIKNNYKNIINNNN